jgi:hypothetical protein
LQRSKEITYRFFGKTGKIILRKYPYKFKPKIIIFNNHVFLALKIQKGSNNFSAQKGLKTIGKRTFYWRK